MNIIRNPIPIDVVSETTLNIIIGLCIELIYLHPVTLKFVKDNLATVNDSYQFETPEQKLCENLLLDKLRKENWDYVPFKNITSITIYSNQNGNSDDESGSCKNLYIPINEFRYTIEGHPITISDITECAYRMKCGKYDNWHESFGGIKNLEVKDSQIIFEITFDYGS
jgi:hypothetical protein